MLKIDYSVTGMEDVQRALALIRPDAVQRDIADIIEEMASDAANYPPPPSNSTHTRTYNLRQGWLDAQPVFDLTSDTLLATLTNSTPYGMYVQGPEDQAEIHQGRWRTTDAIMDAWEVRAVQAVEDGLARLLGA